LEPSIAFFTGESATVETLAFRAMLTILGFVLFFRLRDVINHIYQTRSGDAHPALRSVWNL
jgi:hypothetical protein